MRPTDGDQDDTKLIPEWGADADDQIIWVGLAVVAVALLLFGWNALRGGDDESTAAVAPIAGGVPVDSIAVDGAGPLASDLGSVAASASATVTTVATEPPTTVAAPTTTPAATDPAPTIAEVQATAAALPGDVTGSLDGSTVVLEGFVADAAERQAAEDAAAGIAGVDEVRNNLVVLGPPVLTALAQTGVVDPGVDGSGTSVTVSGTIQSEDERASILAAAAGVEGVTEVIDELTISLAADLNELPQVQFAIGSAAILEASFPDLDAAAELIIAANGAVFEIQGFTDVQGDADRNLGLSQDRADAVRQHLVNAGVDESVLTAVGYGETEQFAAGRTDDALAANRLVRFEQTN